MKTKKNWIIENEYYTILSWKKRLVFKKKKHTISKEKKENIAKELEAISKALKVKCWRTSKIVKETMLVRFASITCNLDSSAIVSFGLHKSL